MIRQTLQGEFLKMAETQQKLEPELLSKQNVAGVALGNKIEKGEDTGEPALLVLVNHKLPPEMLRPEDMVPEKVDNLRTDVIEVGEVRAGQFGTTVPPVKEARTNGFKEDLALEERTGERVGRRTETLEFAPRTLTQRIRPVMGGFSVAHPNVTAGTIATACYDLTPFPGIPSTYYILSNNHVLANSNDANIGDPILQPGPYDGGSYPSDMIGRLSRFITINWMTPSTTPLNYVDAAVAEVPFHLASREIFWIGHVKGMYAAPNIGDIVQKTGRTTNFTTGKIIAVNATIDVNYGAGRVARFANQILTTNMSAGGDSGSLVLNLDEHAVGLLFAGSPTVTVINNILYVQYWLRIRVHEK